MLDSEYHTERLNFADFPLKTDSISKCSTREIVKKKIYVNIQFSKVDDINVMRMLVHTSRRSCVFYAIVVATISFFNIEINMSSYAYTIQYFRNRYDSVRAAEQQQQPYIDTDCRNDNDIIVTPKLCGKCQATKQANNLCVTTKRNGMNAVQQTQNDALCYCYCITG